jgi:ribonucleoside-diphosphate reductase alpha chain
MQAALQRHVDSSISKTINCPADMSFEDFKGVYLDGYALGLKGCTTFRPNAVTGSVLSRCAAVEPTPAASAVAKIIEEAPAPEAEEPLLPGLALGGARQGAVVYMAKPLEREGALAGFTYKIKWPAATTPCTSPSTTPSGTAGAARSRCSSTPRTSSTMPGRCADAHDQCDLPSRGDIAFVVEELKAVFDPQGGQWMGGRYVPSLLAAIGQVIETHMIRTGFLVPEAENGARTAARSPCARCWRRSAWPRQDVPALQFTIPPSAGRLLGVQFVRLLEMRLNQTRAWALTLHETCHFL